MTEKTLSIALLGCGTVGTQVVRLLGEQADDLAARCGARLIIKSIAVRDRKTPRPDYVDTALLTTDINEAIAGADIVIELMGGMEPAKSAILAALRSGATVVTGNKALLAKCGPELYESAAANNTDLYYEASVAGAVPVVYGLRESLAGDRVNRILGIVNGTTNYILDQMAVNGIGYEQALSQAQELGFAEADPTADVDGLDAGAKCAILASLAFHTRISSDDVPTEGIRGISAEDIAQAKIGGYVIKLLAIAERISDENGDESFSARVHPALVPNTHPLASVSEAFNAIVFECESAGRLMFYGQGAGGAPTASAVLSDVVAGASHIVRGGHAPHEQTYANLPAATADKVLARYHWRVRVQDRPGVLADIGIAFARHGVSIESVHQANTRIGEDIVVAISSHQATEAALLSVAKELAETSAITEVLSVLRVEAQ